MYSIMLKSPTLLCVPASHSCLMQCFHVLSCSFIIYFPTKISLRNIKKKLNASSDNRHDINAVVLQSFAFKIEKFRQISVFFKHI